MPAEFEMDVEIPPPTKTNRQRAQSLLRKNAADETSRTPADVHALVHELQLYQSYLEILESQLEKLNRREPGSCAPCGGFSELYDLAPLGYLTLSKCGHIRQANLCAANLLGVKREQLIATSLLQYIKDDHGDRLQEHLSQVYQDGAATCDVNLVKQCGNTCEARLMSRRLDDRQRDECWTVVSDVSELKLAQRNARRSERLASLGTLTAGIAHEINNPLWMISLQADTALNALKNPNGQAIVAKCLREIQNLVGRGGRIVNRVQQFSREDVSRKWCTSLRDVLLRARDFSLPRAKRSRVSIEVELSADLPAIAINPFDMEHVFVNLLANAIDASGRDATIRVSAQCGSRSIEVAVKDQGRGMSDDEIHHMFDPFFTTKRGRGGTGLGLSVVHSIVEEHGGSIDVTSQVGQGSVITVRLPLREFSTKVR